MLIPLGELVFEAGSSVTITPSSTYYPTFDVTGCASFSGSLQFAPPAAGIYTVALYKCRDGEFTSISVEQLTSDCSQVLEATPTYGDTALTLNIQPQNRCPPERMGLPSLASLTPQPSLSGPSLLSPWQLL